MVELTLVIPFILVVVMGVYDIGRMFLSYLALTQSVRETVRYGAGIADLEPADTIDCHSTPANQAQCANVTPKHLLIQNRLARLLSLQSLPIENIRYHSTFVGDAAWGETGSDQETVRINLTATYDSFFLPFDLLPLALVESGPHLSTVPAPPGGGVASTCNFVDLSG